MWFFYVLVASVIWGVSYAAMGRVLSRGFDPLAAYFCQIVLCLIPVTLAMALSGKFARLGAELRSLGSDWFWLPIGTAAAAIAGVLVLTAIGAKNAPVAALIEISYPLFAAFFCWLFFRDSHLNWQTAGGAVLIFAGVIVVGLSNRASS